MSTVSFSVHLMLEIDQKMCLPKKDLAFLIVFWNLHGAFGGSKNQATSLAGSNSTAKVILLAQRDTTASNIPSLMARISVWMVELASTCFVNCRRTEPRLAKESAENESSKLILMMPWPGGVHEISELIIISITWHKSIILLSSDQFGLAEVLLSIPWYVCYFIVFLAQVDMYIIIYYFLLYCYVYINLFGLIDSISLKRYNNTFKGMCLCLFLIINWTIMLLVK